MSWWLIGALLVWGGVIVDGTWWLGWLVVITCFYCKVFFI
jgi:hypothetical protein